MIIFYAVFKFLHVVSVIVWLGVVATLSLLNFRLSRSNQPQVLRALVQESRFYGRAVVGPAALITLIAGVVTATRMGVAFGSLWIVWGFLAIFLSLALGASFIRVTTNKLSQLVATAVDHEQVAAVQNRLFALNILNLCLLLSAVWVMLVKPSL